MKLFRQVQLKSDNIEATVNLEDSPKLKVGNSLTMKDHEMGPDRWWNIISVGKPHPRGKTYWNNNI